MLADAGRYRTEQANFWEAAPLVWDQASRHQRGDDFNLTTDTCICNKEVTVVMDKEPD